MKFSLSLPIIFLLSWFLLSLCACSLGQKDKTIRKNRVVKILFLGNSYTALKLTKDGKDYTLNNIPEIAQKLLGPKYLIEYCVRAEYSMKMHFETQECKNKIQSEDWDYIVVQERSKEILQNYSESERYIKEISYWTRNTKFVGFQNWPVKESPVNYERLQQRSQVLSAEWDEDRVSIGDSFHYLKKDGYELYSDDGRHPNVYGIYVAAYTIALRFEKDPWFAGRYEKDVEIVADLLEVQEAQSVFGDTFNYVLTPKALKLLRQKVRLPRANYFESLAN